MLVACVTREVQAITFIKTAASKCVSYMAASFGVGCLRRRLLTSYFHKAHDPLSKKLIITCCHHSAQSHLVFLGLETDTHPDVRPVCFYPRPKFDAACRQTGAQQSVDHPALQGHLRAQQAAKAPKAHHGHCGGPCNLCGSEGGEVSTSLADSFQP